MPQKSAPRRRKPVHKGTASAHHGERAAQKSGASVARKERGGWLTAMLIIIIIHGLFNIAALITLRKTANPLDLASVPAWLWAGAILDGLLTIASGVALWYWKRWGLYLYVVATFASIVLGLMVFGNILVSFYNIIPLGILALILQSQRKMQLLT
jgi:hypothetical protein